MPWRMRGSRPEMFWLAKRFSNPVFAWSEQKLLDHSTHPDAYDLAWFDRDAKSPQQAPPWALDAIFRGVDISCFRSAWDDPNALYLAVKGGDNKAPHAGSGSWHLRAGRGWRSLGGGHRAGRLRSARILYTAAVVDTCRTRTRSAQYAADRRSESGCTRGGPHHAAGLCGRLQLGADGSVASQSGQG